MIACAKCGGTVFSAVEYTRGSQRHFYDTSPPGTQWVAHEDEYAEDSEPLECDKCRTQFDPDDEQFEEMIAADWL